MATSEQILSIIEELHHAYPGQKLHKASVQVYINHLCDIHPCLLEKCAENLIEKSTWFPRISEIRAEAARIVGRHVVSTWEPPLKALWVRYRQLEHDFYHYRTLDPNAWLELSADFASRDQPYSAAKAQERLKNFQQILSAEAGANQ